LLCGKLNNLILNQSMMYLYHILKP